MELEKTEISDVASGILELTWIFSPDPADWNEVGNGSSMSHYPGGGPHYCKGRELEATGLSELLKSYARELLGKLGS